MKLLAEWFWVDRWVGSSGFSLPLEARGLYREMLSQAWRRGARLPSDHASIRRICGVERDEWDRAWPLVAQYWREEAGALVNDTQLEVYQEAVGRLERAQARASAGAKARHRPAQALLKQSSSTAQAELKQGSGTAQALPSVSVSVSNGLTEESLPRPRRLHALSPEAEAAIDAADSETAFEEKRLCALLLEIRNSGQDVQSVIDSLPLKAPWSVATWTRTGSTGLPRGEGAVNLRRMLSGHLEARRRASAKRTPRKGGAPSWDRGDESGASAVERAVEWVRAKWSRDAAPYDRAELRRMVEGAAPADLVESVYEHLLFGVYPGLPVKLMEASA